MVKKLDLYIGKIFLQKFLKIFFGFFILIFLIDTLESSRKLTNEFLVLDLLEYAFIKSIHLSIEILFFVIFLATLFSLIQLNKTSEIHVIKTSGYNNWQLSRPFIIILVLISFLPILFSNVISKYYEQNENNQNISFGSTGIWFKEQNLNEFFLINLNKYNEANDKFQDINIICLRCNGISPKSVVKAKFALIENQEIRLQNVLIYQHNKLQIAHKNYHFKTSLSKSFVFSQIKNQDYKYLSFFQTLKLYQEAKRSGVNQKEYKITIHKYLSTPILFLATFLLAMVIGNIKPREGNFFKIILIGIILNFIIYFCITITEQLIHLNIGDAITLLYIPKIILLLILIRKVSLSNF